MDGRSELRALNIVVGLLLKSHPERERLAREIEQAAQTWRSTDTNLADVPRFLHELAENALGV